MAKIYFLTSPGIAKYPHIVEPDTEGQYATGKHTTKLIMTPAEAASLIKEIESIAKDHKIGVKNCKLPFKPETTKSGDNQVATGNILFSFSSKFAPLIVGANGKPIKVSKMSDEFDIGAGSKLRIAGEIYPYDKGISLQMSQVQVLDLVAGRQSVFDAQEGTFDGSEYEADNDNEASGSFTDANKEALGI